MTPSLTLPDFFSRIDWMTRPQIEKETKMTKTNDRPLHRVTFSRVTGKDRNGLDVLTRPKEIGAVWPRKSEDKKGAS